MKVDHQKLIQELNKSEMRILRTEVLAKSVQPTELVFTKRKRDEISDILADLAFVKQEKCCINRRITFQSGFLWQNIASLLHSLILLNKIVHNCGKQKKRK